MAVARSPCFRHPALGGKPFFNPIADSDSYPQRPFSTKRGLRQNMPSGRIKTGISGVKSIEMREGDRDAGPAWPAGVVERKYRPNRKKDVETSMRNVEGSWIRESPSFGLETFFFPDDGGSAAVQHFWTGCPRPRPSVGVAFVIELLILCALVYLPLVIPHRRGSDMIFNFLSTCKARTRFRLGRGACRPRRDTILGHLSRRDPHIGRFAPPLG